MGASPGLTLGPLVPSLVFLDWQNEGIVFSQCLNLQRANGQHPQQLSHAPRAWGQKEHVGSSGSWSNLRHFEPSD